MVVSKRELIENMMGAKYDFEDVLLCRKDRQGEMLFERLCREGLTIGNAKLCLDVFLSICKKSPDFASRYGILRINKRSIFVARFFSISIFVDQILNFYDSSVECLLEDPDLEI
ncbi:hypothetical protein A7978_05745 (plasmid) [Borrelia turicatae]|uniref:Uncharacterized protein n=1 Tax=Borrelia turicatae TaxID=142 RepID=A0A172XD25_BORTU|nr:hypothetical protein [Borrelia turicatae]ANF34541.1 hypothetical protein A7978_05745 [Borrelia turicatae]UPA15643.1 hypothetical protein btBTE5EL_001346 [Borrelia turicatae]